MYLQLAENENAPATRKKVVENPYIYLPPAVDRAGNKVPGMYVREDYFDDLPQADWTKLMKQLKPYQPQGMSENELADRASRKAKRAQRKADRQAKKKKKQEDKLAKRKLKRAIREENRKIRKENFQGAGNILGSLFNGITGAITGRGAHGANDGGDASGGNDDGSGGGGGNGGDNGGGDVTKPWYKTGPGIAGIVVGTIVIGGVAYHFLKPHHTTVVNNSSGGSRAPGSA